MDLVNQMLLEAVSPLSGIASLETSVQGNLSTVLIGFQVGDDLAELTQQVSEALYPIRPEGETGDGFAEEEAGDLSCVEETKTFELQISGAMSPRERVSSRKIGASAKRTSSRWARSKRRLQTVIRWSVKTRQQGSRHRDREDGGASWSPAQRQKAARRR